MSTKPAIILFDGVCNLCNSSINFVIDRDPNRRFRYAALQSLKGKQLMSDLDFNAQELSSIILIENKHIYRKSTAALKIARLLDFPWPLLYGFILVPPFIRNLVYDIIARNRYKWFGIQNECRIPSAGLRELFLEE
ncbi:MAG: DCC1-like thiol-disulfide oxidoreductase family protein [Balneolales bacterium]